MSKTLLLADDSVVIQKLVGLSFANEDVEIVATDNGDDAVEMARQLVPDVVLADVVMPGRSGYEVCEALKQDPALAHVPVLLLTGTFEAFDEARAVAVGATGQITKPFEAQALVARVKEVMAAPPPVAAPAEAPAVPETPESEFFDANVTSLSTTMPPASQIETSTSATPAADALFGSPGEAITDELDTPSVDATVDAPPQAAPAVESPPPIPTAQELPPPVPTPPAAKQPLAAAKQPPLAAAEQPPPLPTSPSPPPPPVETTASPEASQTRILSDPLAEFSDDLGLGEGLDTPGGASAIEVDSALAGGVASAEATILVADDDPNAKTSPSLAVATPSPTPVEEAMPPAAGEPDAGADPFAGSFDPASPVADLDASLEPESGIDLAGDSLGGGAESLDLGPTNLEPEDLDFAFDVSEQRPVTDLDDSLEDSPPSLRDISDSQLVADPSAQQDPLADRYDVSSSDLAASSTLPPSRPAAAAEPPPAPVAETAPTPAEPAGAPLAGVPEEELISVPPADDGAAAPVADLSPRMQQQIQEALEKVAWEAFSDLSESIVKQVMGRVEQIAWEVIPQMAETLVREEIRKMKGEED